MTVLIILLCVFFGLASLIFSYFMLVKFFALCRDARETKEAINALKTDIGEIMHWCEWAQDEIELLTSEKKLKVKNKQ